MITIIDYGMGNVGSIKNMFRKIGYEALISSDKKDIGEASKLILPGVGRFDTAMGNLGNLDLTDLIKEKAGNGTPLLGICLGMQLLAENSEEGSSKGLGIIPGNVQKFSLESRYKVPHMGWNKLYYPPDSPLFKGFDQFEETRFYFVHAYYFNCSFTENVLAQTTYSHTFTSAVQKGNTIGVQFHPEKSHVFGMSFLKNFAVIE